MTHDNEYHGKNDAPCPATLDINDASLPCELKLKHKGMHQTETVDMNGSKITVMWKVRHGKD